MRKFRMRKRSRSLVWLSIQPTRALARAKLLTALLVLRAAQHTHKERGSKMVRFVAEEKCTAFTTVGLIITSCLECIRSGVDELRCQKRNSRREKKTSWRRTLFACWVWAQVLMHRFTREVPTMTINDLSPLWWCYFSFMYACKLALNFNKVMLR